MRKLCFYLMVVLAVTLFSSPSKADEVQYNLSGVFGPDTVGAPLSGANGSFAMSFSLPQMPAPVLPDSGAGDFTIFSVPFQYSFTCDGCATAVSFSGMLEDVVFGVPSPNLVVEFVTTGPTGHDYYWQFDGPQLFSGTLDNPFLISGGPDNLATGAQFDLDANPFVDVGNAKITAMGPSVSTPEPSSLTLLIAALVSVGLIAWFKTQRA
jgi:hypothetical protein